jgi:hypothetical protein
MPAAPAVAGFFYGNAAKYHASLSNSATKRVMKTVFQVLSLLIFQVCTGYAQTPAVTSWSVALGSNVFARQDQTFSPFVHSGSGGLAARVSFQHFRKWEHQAELAFAATSFSKFPTFRFYTPEIKDEAQTGAPHQATMLDVGYSVGHVLWSRPKHRWSAGIFTDLDVDALYYVHARISHFGYFIAIHGGLWTRWRYTPHPKHQLALTGHLPVLAWVAHSPYLINDDVFIEQASNHKTLTILGNFIAGGAVKNMSQYQRATLDWRYHYAWRKKWKVGIAGQTTWMHLKSVKPIRSILFNGYLSIEHQL